MQGKRFCRLLVLALFAMWTGSMTAQVEVPVPQNVYARQSLSLNGDWNYFVDMQEQGYYDYRMNPTKWGYFLNAKPKRPSDLVEYDFDASPTMHVPTTRHPPEAAMTTSFSLPPFRRSSRSVRIFLALEDALISSRVRPTST